MRFRLTYEGQLKSNQSSNIAKHKHELRIHFHPQLKHLWSLYSPLSTYLEVNARSTKYSIGRHRFVPLIRQGSPYQCFLDILFLSEGRPGVFDSGDLDNRVKTLVDSLRMPRNKDEIPDIQPPTDEEDGLFCLLEDDSFISSLSVQRDLLLAPRKPSSNYAKVTIRVAIDSYMPDGFDLGFGKISGPRYV